MKTCLFAALTVLSLSAAGPASAADAHPHGHEHGQAAAPATLQLDAGRKWQTDAPLRKEMGNVRQAMAGSLHAIHEKKMSARAYERLAKKVEASVGEIVANCKLPPAADAQLHLVVADMLAGAEQMAGKAGSARRIDGAIRVVGALDSYGRYFDDPGFKPLEH